MEHTPAAARLVSPDALRGFDMFWILGMEAVAAELVRAHDSPWTRFLAFHLDHAPWQGFHFLDLIFPLFVFIAGVSLVFSLTRSLEKVGRPATVRKLFVRFAILYILGLFYYHGLANGVEQIRWVGVLQRIAICGLAAGVLFCFTNTRGRIAALVALLLGYWATMSFVPVPGGAGEHFVEGPQGNLANWFDFHYLPGKRWDKTHDPEGILSTIPAIASCLLGVLAGEYLRNHKDAPARKAATLFLAGALLACLGWLWGLQFPVIKKLWTSSYVLVAGGYSLMLLGAFYWIIDVRGFKRWAIAFVWIGMNPITLYVGEHVINQEWVVASVLGGPIAHAFGTYEKTWLALGVLFLNLLIAWFLYSRKIFLRA
jgi:predicted acyltransferase